MLPARNVVITGANSGIGLETAVALASLGDRVVICCRDGARGERAAAAIGDRSGSDLVEVVALDLGSLASVRAAAADLAERTPTIDVLVNNAGLIVSSRSTTVDGFETMFGVNHLGHFLLTALLEPQIRAAAEPRVLNVSSVAHHWAVGGLRFDDLQSERWFNGWVVYGRSKLANIHFTQELARRWPDVAVNALHPGTVATSFGRDGDTAGLSSRLLAASPLVAVHPSAGAATTVFLATAEEGRRITGRYWVRRRVGHTSVWARDRDADERLWTASEELVATHPA